MSVELIIVIGIAYYLVTIASIFAVLHFMSKKNKTTVRKQMDELERDKNLIISASLIAELNKVEPLIGSSNMKDTLVLWQKRFQKIIYLVFKPADYLRNFHQVETALLRHKKNNKQCFT